MKGKRCGWMFVGVVLLLLAAAPSVQAYSLLGGQVLSVHDQAFRISIGYPEVTFAYHIPLMRNFEVAPKFTQFFGVDTEAPVVGNTLGAELRWQVYGSGRFTLALHFDPALVLQYYNHQHHDTAVGLCFGLPAVRMGYQVNGNFAMVGGLRFPIAVFFHPSPAVGRFPVLFEAGMEYSLSTPLNIFLMFGIGPDVWVFENISSAKLYVNAALGISYRL